MNMNSKALLAAAGIAAVAFSPAAYATEGGDIATKPGAFIGASAGVPPPGIYMFNQVFTYQANLAGPGTAKIGTHVGEHVNVDVCMGSDLIAQCRGARSGQIALEGEDLIEHINARRRNAGARSDEAASLRHGTETGLIRVCRRECERRYPRCCQ